MVLKKTCWLTTIHPCRVGALIATHDTVDLERFIRFGFFLGVSFQIQDDLLNFVADERYGKELHGDIVEGKRTLMLIHLLREAASDERSRLADFLARPRSARSRTDVQWVRARMDAYGCLDYARRVAHGLAGAACHECALAYAGLPDSRDYRFIEALATWVLERTEKHAHALDHGTALHTIAPAAPEDHQPEKAPFRTCTVCSGAVTSHVSPLRSRMIDPPVSAPAAGTPTLRTGDAHAASG